MKPRLRFFNGMWYCKDNWAIGIGETIQEAYGDLLYWNAEGRCPLDNELQSTWYIFYINS